MADKMPPELLARFQKKAEEADGSSSSKVEARKEALRKATKAKNMRAK